ncbi:hypothetical protein EV138_6261 [Kribbella voronezhensis]|uniref:Uncharacterized protein n=1 Tax=Kribbella voronezhensis TaxID=2512212 RepID=A0A4R7SZ33_9ACTN|nr:hypothetical protein [Kribbella voronezhensis]TDU83797.1 hypothetical protein EV138_6261 [Kribbella voronezhensis]
MSTDRPRRAESWVAMQTRRLGFGRNPLRRPSDRFEALLTWIVLLTGLLMVPAGAAAGTSIRDASQTRATEQRMLLHEVLARTTAETPALTGQEIGLVTWPVTVSWQDETGLDHRGRTDVALGTKAGTEVTVWIDGVGAVAKPPRPAGDSAAIGTAAGFGIVACCWLALWLFLLLARCALDRRRLANWAAEWKQVAADWTRRDR